LQTAVDYGTASGRLRAIPETTLAAERTMLGPTKPRRLDQPIAVSLEDLVPVDHFYRHLEAKLDLGFVRDWTREVYAERGRPSIDPVVFFKLQLVMFFEGIRSERQLIATASLNLAHRWYLGYPLDEELPDHSSLTRIRQRMGVEVFQRFFEQVVDLCQDAGLVWGQELYFDATQVRADADTDSLVPRFYADAKAHVVDIFTDAADPPDASQTPPEDGLLHFPATTDEAGVASDSDRWNLLEERRLDPTRPSHRGYRRTSDFWVSTTDPDATPMWTAGKARLGYHDHYVVDGGKRRIILAALVTPADVMENQPMLGLLWRVRFRRKLHPHQATGDTTYGTVENIVALEDAGIRAYVPLPNMNHRRPFYGQDEFTYDATHDTYSCPAGHTLRRERIKHTESVIVYRVDAAACNACPLKANCTESSRGRIVHRSLYADYLEKVRGYHATEAYEKAMRKRQVWVEPLFAEAKLWHGLRRFRRRGLENVNIEGLLIATGQNLKRWLSATGWGRRHAPCGSLVALPGELQRLSAVAG
jgi:transposase